MSGIHQPLTSITLPLPEPAATEALGRCLGKFARPGDIITLAGDLGAGKTTLTQAIGRGLAVPDDCYITSPTFALIHEYPGRLPLFHLDLYRLADETEAEELGLDDYLYGDGLSVIEWPDRLGSLMPANRLHIELAILSPSSRRATLRPLGPTWPARLAELAEQLSSRASIQLRFDKSPDFI